MTYENTENKAIAEVKTTAKGKVEDGAYITEDGKIVRDKSYYRLLSMIRKFGFVTRIEVEWLFFDRNAKRAKVAAERLLRSAKRDCLIVGKYLIKDNVIIYGSTAKGAEFLRKRGVADAKPTAKRLHDASHAEHRRWANLIALSALARGGKALSERDLLNQSATYTQAYGQIPDVKTVWDFDIDGSGLATYIQAYEQTHDVKTGWDFDQSVHEVAVWHEVDLTRRKPISSKKMSSFIKNGMLLSNRHIDDKSRWYAVVYHAETKKIVRDLVRMLTRVQDELRAANDDGFREVGLNGAGNSLLWVYEKAGKLPFPVVIGMLPNEFASFDLPWASMAPLPFMEDPPEPCLSVFNVPPEFLGESYGNPVRDTNLSSLY